jgi:hypothetical protein
MKSKVSILVILVSLLLVSFSISAHAATCDGVLGIIWGTAWYDADKALQSQGFEFISKDIDNTSVGNGNEEMQYSGSFAGDENCLYDMNGNVWQWCFDWYPGANSSSRVRRGGYWFQTAIFVQISCVVDTAPTEVHSFVFVQQSPANRLFVAQDTQISAVKPNNDAASMAGVVAGNNQFAWELYQKIKADPENKDKNIFFSPYSISTALIMTYAGSRGNTAKWMAKDCIAGLMVENIPET